MRTKRQRHTASGRVDIPRRVTLGLYTGSESSRASGKRLVTIDNAVAASSLANGAPRQKCGP